MARDTALSFRITKEMKEALERVAKDDERSVSYVVEKAVREMLKKRGYLSTQDAKTPRGKSRA